MDIVGLLYLQYLKSILLCFVVSKMFLLVITPAREDITLSLQMRKLKCLCQDFSVIQCVLCVSLSFILGLLLFTIPLCSFMDKLSLVSYYLSLVWFQIVIEIGLRFLKSSWNGFIIIIKFFGTNQLQGRSATFTHKYLDLSLALKRILHSGEIHFQSGLVYKFFYSVAVLTFKLPELYLDIQGILSCFFENRISQQLPVA